MAMATGKPRYGLGDFAGDLAAMAGLREADPRGALAAVLPPVPAGWVRRAYLPADGRAITEAARPLSREARLRAGGDLERFGMFAQAGGDQRAWTMTAGGQRIVVGLRRPPQLMKTGAPLRAAMLWSEGQPFDAEADIAAGELRFRRRLRALSDSDAPMPYDLYRAEARGGLVVEVMSDAPSDAVEAWLMGFALPGGVAAER
ncbi:MAG: hypothetical protein R3D85_03020 [Paracoccaceae bacterium]